MKGLAEKSLQKSHHLGGGAVTQTFTRERMSRQRCELRTKALSNDNNSKFHGFSVGVNCGTCDLCVSAKPLGQDTCYSMSTTRGNTYLKS